MGFTSSDRSLRKLGRYVWAAAGGEGSRSLWQDGDESNSDQGAESDSRNSLSCLVPLHHMPPSPPTPFLLNEKTWSLMQAAINLLQESELTESQPHTHTHIHIHTCTHSSTKENKQNKYSKAQDEN